MTTYMETGKKAAEFFSLLGRIVKGAAVDYWRKKNALKRGGRAETVSMEALMEQGDDIPFDDPTEGLINRIHAKQVIHILKEHVSKEEAPAQWEVFQAACVVVQDNVDASKKREFYDAIYEHLEGRYPGHYRREGIKTYWFNLCKTLQRIWSQQIGRDEL